MGGNVSIKKLITSPTASGILIGVLTLAGIIIMEEWFPRIGQAWDRHRTMVKAVWFTLVLFALCVYYLWRWRRRNSLAFWAAICTLFLLHVSGVLLYTTLVQPILGWQWIILLVLESFFMVFLVDWSTKRFRHLGEGRRKDGS